MITLADFTRISFYEVWGRDEERFDRAEALARLAVVRSEDQDFRFSWINPFGPPPDGVTETPRLMHSEEVLYVVKGGSATLIEKEQHELGQNQHYNAVCIPRHQVHRWKFNVAGPIVAVFGRKNILKVLEPQDQPKLGPQLI